MWGLKIVLHYRTFFSEGGKVGEYSVLMSIWPICGFYGDKWVYWLKSAVFAGFCARFCCGPGDHAEGKTGGVTYVSG